MDTGPASSWLTLLPSDISDVGMLITSARALEASLGNGIWKEWRLPFFGATWTWKEHPRVLQQDRLCQLAREVGAACGCEQSSSISLLYCKLFYTGIGLAVKNKRLTGVSGPSVPCRTSQAIPHMFSVHVTSQAMQNWCNVRQCSKGPAAWGALLRVLRRSSKNAVILWLGGLRVAGQGQLLQRQWLLSTWFYTCPRWIHLAAISDVHLRGDIAMEWH